MITVYWAANDVRVVTGPHEPTLAGLAGDVVTRHFSSIDEALKELKPTNRAIPILKYMQETAT